MQFEWDIIKADNNIRKHGVSFDEAETVFYDDFAVIFDDELHSRTEIRELLFGNSNKNRLLIVSYTERNGFIRIISARKASKKERKQYEENR